MSHSAQVSPYCPVMVFTVQFVASFGCFELCYVYSVNQIQNVVFVHVNGGIALNLVFKVLWVVLQCW